MSVVISVCVCPVMGVFLHHAEVNSFHEQFTSVLDGVCICEDVTVPESE